MTKIEFDKATIYTPSDMMGNVIKTEVRRGDVEIRPYAQYNNAVHVRFVGKGKRKMSGFVKSHTPFVLILEGHGHPDPDSLYGESETTDNGISVSRGRYRSFDSGWVADFRALIDKYMGGNAVKVIFEVVDQCDKGTTPKALVADVCKVAGLSA